MKLPLCCPLTPRNKQQSGRMKVQSTRGNTKKQPRTFKHEQEEFPETSSTTIYSPSKLIPKLYIYVSIPRSHSQFNLFSSSPVQSNITLYTSALYHYIPPSPLSFTKRPAAAAFSFCPSPVHAEEALTEDKFREEKNRVEPNSPDRIIPAKSELFLPSTDHHKFRFRERENSSFCLSLSLSISGSPHHPRFYRKKTLAPVDSAFTFLIQNGHLCRQFEDEPQIQV